MKVNIIDKRNSKKSKSVKLKDGIIFLHVTEDEAIDLIRSLSTQISSKNGNGERLETYTVEGHYFSISVGNFKYTKTEYEYNKQKEENLKLLEQPLKKKDKKN